MAVLDLNKQIHIKNMFQLATMNLILTDALSSLSEVVSCGRGKDVTVFQKGEIINLHQAKKGDC